MPLSEVQTGVPSEQPISNRLLGLFLHRSRITHPAISALIRLGFHGVYPFRLWAVTGSYDGSSAQRRSRMSESSSFPGVGCLSKKGTDGSYRMPKPDTPSFLLTSADCSSSSEADLQYCHRSRIGASSDSEPKGCGEDVAVTHVLAPRRGDTV